MTDTASTPEPQKVCPRCKEARPAELELQLFVGYRFDHGVAGPSVMAPSTDDFVSLTCNGCGLTLSGGDGRLRRADVVNADLEPDDALEAEFGNGMRAYAEHLINAAAEHSS